MGKWEKFEEKTASAKAVAELNSEDVVMTQQKEGNMTLPKHNQTQQQEGGGAQQKEGAETFPKQVQPMVVERNPEKKRGSLQERLAASKRKKLS